MTKPLAPDICFIGGGSSVPLAIAVSAGLSVALVETGRTDGGRCALARSLALNAAGRHAEALARGAELGIADVKPEVDFRKLAARIQDLATASTNSSADRFTALGVRLIRAEARFKDGRTLVAGDVELRARCFVIATGSLPAPPRIEGLDASDCLTEDTVFELARKPGHLIVVGDSPAAVELAQAYRRLGSDVTVIAAGPLLAEHDHEMVAVVLRRLAAEGVMILEKATVNEVQRKGKGEIRAQVLSEGGMIAVDGTHLLVAGHRIPDIAGLELQKAGVTHGENGVTVSPALRTSNRRVYAIGDVAGPRHMAHVVEDQAMHVVRGLLAGRDENLDNALIPQLVFTDPQLAHVGMKAAAAEKANRGVTVLRWPYAENQRARAEGSTAGHIKIVVDKDGKILGATIAGANAVELIGLWALALSKNMAVGDVAGLASPASTFGEIGKRAAISYIRYTSRSSIGRKLAGLFRVFG